MKNINDLANAIHYKGFKGDPLDIVEIRPGRYISMDNRRLLCAKVSKINVDAIIHNWNDLLDE